MKKDFDSFYSEIQNNDLRNIWEEANEERSKGNKIALSIIAILDILVIAFILNKGIDSVFFAFFGIYMFVADTIVYAVVRAIFSRNYSKYNDVFKEKVIDGLFNNFFDAVDYIPKKEMPESIYDEGNYEKYDRYSSEDYVDAKLDGKYIVKMADVTTEERREETDSKGNTRTYYVTKFSGLFAKIYLDKIMKDSLQIQGNTLLKKSRVEMDDSDFEKYFDVTSADKIAAMQILTHDVMQMLVDYRTRLKCHFDIYIKGRAMYIRVHTGDLFEAKINNKTVLDEKTLREYYDVVDFIYTTAIELIIAMGNVQT